MNTTLTNMQKRIKAKITEVSYTDDLDLELTERDIREAGHGNPEFFELMSLYHFLTRLRELRGDDAACNWDAVTQAWAREIPVENVQLFTPPSHSAK